MCVYLGSVAVNVKQGRLVEPWYPPHKDNSSPIYKTQTFFKLSLFLNILDITVADYASQCN